MELKELNKPWYARTREEKLSLIESTNERRIETFKVRTRKKSKKSTTSKRRRKSYKKPSPSNMMELLNKMTPDQRENFKLMTQLDAKKTS